MSDPRRRAAQPPPRQCEQRERERERAAADHERRERWSTAGDLGARRRDDQMADDRRGRTRRARRPARAVPATSSAFCSTSGTSLRPRAATSAGWLSGSIVRPPGARRRRARGPEREADSRARGRRARSLSPATSSAWRAPRAPAAGLASTRSRRRARRRDVRRRRCSARGSPPECFPAPRAAEGRTSRCAAAHRERAPRPPRRARCVRRSRPRARRRRGDASPTLRASTCSPTLGRRRSRSWRRRVRLRRERSRARASTSTSAHPPDHGALLPDAPSPRRHRCA